MCKCRYVYIGWLCHPHKLGTVGLGLVGMRLWKSRTVRANVGPTPVLNTVAAPHSAVNQRRLKHCTVQ